jgi:TonB-dependent starch-binding outer membrane protein SusC
MGRRILQAILTLFAVAATAHAQANGRIVGRVSAEDGRPIPGIQITVTGTSRGAASDTAGRFTIGGVPAGNYTVLARGIGFASSSKPVTVTASQSATVDFTLTTAPAQLNPIVVVGYGTEDRRAVTGSVGTVQAIDLKDVPTSDPMKALQGRLPGVDIVA